MKTGLALPPIGKKQYRLQAKAAELQARLARAIANKVYQAPAAEDLVQARRLFQLTLQGQSRPASLTADWAALGLEFQEVAGPAESLWLLTEPAGRETGRGWYLFRPHRESSIALEAPHARNDIHTGKIALQLFLAGKARTLAASTITRHRADMAHLEDTFFQAFTLAFAEVHRAGLVVQLHGFELGNHRGTQADMIASAGTLSPGPWLTALVQRLRETTSLRAAAYPQDTRQFGAKLNAQGRALQQARQCRFLHLELSMELRKRLLREAGLRRAILDCLSFASTP